ncbi:response regulator [Blastomonas sp. CCH11-A4]|uniref:response regulator n=1 Tax=Blastomonas sp. CCH11-A4 TaxID=1768782 RepID=UPI000825FFAD|nr:response regulator [Blastomonas sp. CCH11-A4]
MSLGQTLAPHLPLLRRYSRALAGDQHHGDAYVKATLQAIIAAPDQFPSDVDARLGLYRVFQVIWGSTHDDREEADSFDAYPDADDDSRRLLAEQRLRRIPPLSRQALLLTAMEGFSNADTAYLMGLDDRTVSSLVSEALSEIDSQIKAKVLIIEDEPIIAMDIETIVRDLGHDVTGIAATRDEAVEQARRDKPGLVLADIQLADDSSGIDAVADILREIDVPVIFITAFPERLLTGERPEPAFLITKPFHRNTVRAAISQALFFFDPETV